MQTKTDQQVTRSMEASDTLTDGRAWLAAQSRYTPYYLLFVLLIGLALGSIATVIKILTGDCSRRARNLHCAARRQCWAALVALWRKYAHRQSRISHSLQLRGGIIEVMSIVTYVLLNLVLVFLNTEGSLDLQAHHAARLANVNVLLVIALASKNNAISWLTGLSYQTLNTLHRWAARVLLLLALVHIGGRIRVNVPPVYSTQTHLLLMQPSHTCGIVALATLVGIVILSARTVRSRWYRWFIGGHIILAYIFVITLILHRPQFCLPVVLGFALQALDRLIRLARIIHHAYCSAITTEDAATITKLAGELLRVSVRTKMSWKPGQFVYLHLPAVAPGGHPFSVANIPSDNGDNQLELLIRAQGGLTRRLWNLPEQDRDLEKADSDSALRLRRCLIEGPYGAAEHTHHFASVLLISGGSGVSVALSHLLDLVRRLRSQASPEQTRRITFVWSIRDPYHLLAIADRLCSCITSLPASRLDIQIYCTSATQDQWFDVEDQLPSCEEKDSIKLRAGRPDLEALIESCVHATERERQLAVLTCGPYTLTSAVSRAVQDAISPRAVLYGEKRRSITLHEESFG